MKIVKTFGVLVAVLSIVTILLSGCVTGIRDMNIASVEMSVEDEEGNQVDKLLPDTVYSLDFRVRDAAGEEYQNPNYRDFRFNELRNMTVVQQARFSVKVKTAETTFHAPGTSLYGFQLSIKGNAYGPDVYTFPLNWSEYSSIDYSGIDGTDGEDGEHGSTAAAESEDTVRGENGQDGEDGTRGYPGSDVRLAVCRYEYNGYDKLLFYDIERNKLYLSEIKKITVNTSGGDGGDGGRGGNGGRGGSYEVETGTIIEGSPGTPGDGGDGGDAGSGGDITLLAPDQELFNYISPVAKGGEGGYGGGPGRSYDDGSLLKRGRVGRNGRDGRDGEIRYRRVSSSELQKILRNIKMPGFDLQNVKY